MGKSGNLWEPVGKTVLESVDRTYNTVSFYQMTHHPPITISDDKHDAQWVRQ